MAGAQNILREDLQLLHTSLPHLIAGSLVYKQQWLESIEVAKIRYLKKGTRKSKMSINGKLCRVSSLNIKKSEQPRKS